MVRSFAIFVVIAAAVLVVTWLDEYTSQPPQQAERVEEPAAVVAAYAPRKVVLQPDGRGHFTALATINGRSVEMLADTGATVVALTEADARRLGYDPRTLSYDLLIGTANGETRAAGIVLDRVEVGGIVVRDVEAMVIGGEALATSLLGMSFLGRLGSVKLSGDSLELTE